MKTDLKCWLGKSIAYEETAVEIDKQSYVPACDQHEQIIRLGFCPPSSTGMKPSF